MLTRPHEQPHGGRYVLQCGDVLSEADLASAGEEQGLTLANMEDSETHIYDPPPLTDARPSRATAPQAVTLIDRRW